MNTFSGLLKIDELYSFLEEHNFKAPTEVQQKVIPLMCENKSVNVLAQTGTGKTLSYALPLVERLKLTEKEHESRTGHPRAIIILPTKELCYQVADVFKSISHHAKLRVRTLVGLDKSKSARSLKDQYVDVIIGGAGKVNKALKSGEIKADDCKYLVLDEADQLLDMGFSKDLKGAYSHFEWSDTLVALVTATRPHNYGEFVEDTFKKVDFYNVELQGAHGIKQNLETFNIHLNFNEKLPMIDMFLNKEAKGSGVIFVNRKEEAQALFKKIDGSFPKLKKYVLQGDMTARDREETIKDFRKTGGILIATDIVARGLDIKSLNWVLNYDLPFEAVYYIHRAGRVGRQGRRGVVYNFVTSKDFALIKRINDAIKGQSSLELSPIAERKGGNKKAPSKSKVTTKQTGRSNAKTKKKTSKVVKRVKRAPRYARK